MAIAIAMLIAFLVYTGPLDAYNHEIVSSSVTISAIAQDAPPPEQRVDQQTRDALLALAMGMAIFSSSLAIGIAYGIRRRIDQIAGPIPDEDDD